MLKNKMLVVNIVLCITGFSFLCKCLINANANKLYIFMCVTMYLLCVEGYFKKEVLKLFCLCVITICLLLSVYGVANLITSIMVITASVTHRHLTRKSRQDMTV